MADHDSLFALADELLGVCVDALTELGGDHDPPERNYVALGLPALDCEQLTVSTLNLAVQDSAPRALPIDRYHKAVYGSLFIASMMITIVRCVPGPTANKQQVPILPRVVDLAQSASLLYGDAYQIWNGVMSAKRAGAFDGLCTELALDPANPIGPSGGLGGWTIPVSAQIDGFTVNNV